MSAAGTEVSVMKWVLFREVMNWALTGVPSRFCT